MASGNRFHVRCACNRLAFALALAATTACWEKAPSYEGQTRLPPYVVMASVLPNPGTLSVVEDGALAVDVPFRSEDLDQNREGRFFVDSEFYTDLEYGGSVFADDTRRVEQLIGLDEGCHMVQLVLTHADNLPRPSSAPLDSSLAAMVYWWAVVPPEEGDVHCPRWFLPPGVGR